MKLFAAPLFVAVFALGALYVWGGEQMFLIALLLSVLEVSLSFDTAVVNARTLENMSPIWRERFLTWGMFVAVFGTRLLLPAFVVAAAARISPLAAISLAWQSPVQYGQLLASVGPLINAFGGAFLLMVALRYFLDEAKKTHWIPFIEKRLVAVGRVESLEVTLTLGVLLLCASLVPTEGYAILSSGCVGIAAFVVIEGLVGLLTFSAAQAARTGFFLFLYLNAWDAAFSLEGVIGAFALTTLLPVILVGLGIGAYFVRAMTLWVVERRALTTLAFLEHGAYWSIAALAACLFMGLFTTIPNTVAASISILFIGSAYLSSLRRKRMRRHNSRGL